MDTLKMLRVFLQVVHHGSFTAAARKMHLSTTAVSRHVKALEDWLGTQLLHRSTRHVRLTVAGQKHHERLTRLVAELENLRAQIGKEQRSPRGEIKVTAPQFLGRRLLGPLLPRFRKEYPDVKIHIYLSDRYFNLVAEGYDVAIRILRSADVNLIVRSLGTMRLDLVAAPAYLARMGAPASIEELHDHECLVDTNAGFLDRWPLRRNGRSVQVRLQSSIGVNNGELIRELALAGTGIALLPDFFVADDITAGRLIVLFPGAVDRVANISVAYPRIRHRSGAVRAFVDYLETNASTVLS